MEEKYATLSKTRTEGIPNLDISCSKNWITIFSLMCMRGIAFVHLVK